MPGLRSETTDTEKEAIERGVVARLLQYAAKMQIANPIIRDILPSEDLNGGGEVGSGHIWQQSISALAFRTVYSSTNPNDRAFAIYKVAALDPNDMVSAIKFWKGVGQTAIKDIWETEFAWLQVNIEAYCDPDGVIFYGASEGYNIDFYGTSSGLVHVLIGGKVVEPRGKILVPKRPFA